MASHQKNISNAAERKKLQAKGQFWTPQWVARAMVRYLTDAGAKEIFDPAVGAGAFFTAAKTVAKNVQFRGTELDADALAEAVNEGITKEELSGVVIKNFLNYEFDKPVNAIVANPPYLRHHAIGAMKETARKMTREAGVSFDGRAGIHIYFLVKCLANLAPGGRAAFIMPADTAEGVFAPSLWKWISERFLIDAVVTFAHEATPFPGVDTNAVIFFMRNDAPAKDLMWARVTQEGTGLEQWVKDGFPAAKNKELKAMSRDMAKTITTGMSRDIVAEVKGEPLSRYARVVRGIATGGNEFFFLTSEQVASEGIPEDYLVRAVGRTRDVSGDRIRTTDLERLDRAGRPTFLLYLDKDAGSVSGYVCKGEAAGIHERALVKTRNPWYRMERRAVPPILFAYLGRGDVRFILNDAKVLPLTGFLCVYPRKGVNARKLWKALNDPATLRGLKAVGKSYGGGAVKVEPRALERLMVPGQVARKAGLEASAKS